MSLSCKIGLHSWDGCKCVACGKTRDENHDWSKGCEKCLKCGKINAGHDWIEDSDTCTRCGKKRESSDWLRKAKETWINYYNSYEKSFNDNISKIQSMEISLLDFQKHWQVILQENFGPVIMKCIENAININPNYIEGYLAKGEFISFRNFIPYSWKEFTPLKDRSDGSLYEINDEAYSLFKTALNINQSSHIAHYFLGIYHENRKEYDLALQEFESSYNLNSNFEGSIFGIVRMLALKNKEKEAQEYYLKVKDLIPLLEKEIVQRRFKWLNYI